MAIGALLGQKASGGGKRVCRFTVGTSTAGWTANDCDYLCDGTDDQVEINAAIQALPAGGGEIVILDGTYNITATIAMNKDNVTLSGNGNSTILKRMWNSGSSEGIVTVRATNGGCCVASLQVDGNKSVYSSNVNRGIYLSGSNSNTITGNTCNNNKDSGIYLSGSNNNNNTITGNTCNNNNIGIYLSGSNSNTITGNTCNNNKDSGIYLFGSNNTITGNTCNNNFSIGIYLFGSSNNTITGNTCNNNNDSGIYLSGSNSNTITGNTCIRGTGTSSDYTSSQYTIRANSKASSNLIVGNNIMGKNYVDSGTNNTWANNKYN